MKIHAQGEGECKTILESGFRVSKVITREMYERFLCTVLCFFSLTMLAQNSLSMQMSYGKGFLNIIEPPINFSFYGTDNTQDISVDLLYSVHDNIQLESGISFGTLNFNYTYEVDNTNLPNSYKAKADVYSMHNILSFPFGLSLVYPIKKSTFLIGAKVIPMIVYTNQEGYYRSTGAKRINGDSLYYFNNYYMDNEIGNLVYPDFIFQYHIGYQYQINNWIGLSLRYENANGRMVSPRYTITRFYRNTFRFGVTIRFIDYKERNNDNHSQ